MRPIYKLAVLLLSMCTSCTKHHLEETLHKDDLYGIWKIVSVKTLPSGEIITSDTSDIAAVWAGLYVSKFEIVDDGTFQIDTSTYGLGNWTFDEINDSITFSRAKYPDIFTVFAVRAQRDSLWFTNAVNEIKSVKNNW